jgi:hypothetical protein
VRVVTGPGPAAAPGRAAVLRLAGAVSLDTAHHSAAALDPDLRVFASDLARPYGFPLAEAQFAAGAGQAYAEMGEAVVDALVPPERPVDLLVEVFASPDVQPGRAASVHLSTYCPGRPFAFALSEQGTAGAFSALALTGSYLGGPGFDRALVLVLEQSALHWEPPAGAAVPDRHTAVGLLWEPGGDVAVSLLPARGGVGGREAAGYVAEALAALPCADPLLLLGPSLAGVGDLPAAETVRARAGSPCTGLWTALAHHLPRVRADRRTVLLADWDPRLGCLDLAVAGPA